MTLTQYFTKVKEEIKKGNYHIINLNNVIIPDKSSIHMESLNYMIYEWNEDHKDDRNEIFDYIIRPNNLDFDFTSIEFKDFFNFLMMNKDKDNDMFIIIIKQKEEKDKIEELDEFWLR